MLLLLRLLFFLILGSMLAVTSWAGMQQSLFDIPREVIRNPWFIATLFDAYWAFLTFWVWVAWKEQSFPARLLWFIAIVLLGNIAMAIYALRELFAVKTSDELALVVTRRNPGTLPLPALLTAAAVGIYWIA